MLLIATAVSQRTIMAAGMRSETLVKRGAVQRGTIGRDVLGAAALLFVGFFFSFNLLQFGLQNGDSATFGFGSAMVPTLGALALLVILFLDWKNATHKTMQQALERITSLTRSCFQVGHFT